MFHWVRGEIFDIEAVLRAIKVKDNFSALIVKNNKKKSSTQNDLDNVTTGKKTIGTMFKNESDTGKMVAKIENTEKESESLKTLYDIMSIYLGEQVIPPFRENRIKLYKKNIEYFNLTMINNAHQTATYWSSVLQNDNIKKTVAASGGD